MTNTEKDISSKTDPKPIASGIYGFYLYECVEGFERRGVYEKKSLEKIVTGESRAKPDESSLSHLVENAETENSDEMSDRLSSHVQQEQNEEYKTREDSSENEMEDQEEVAENDGLKITPSASLSDPSLFSEGEGRGREKEEEEREDGEDDGNQSSNEEEEEEEEGEEEESSNQKDSTSSSTQSHQSQLAIHSKSLK